MSSTSKNGPFVLFKKEQPFSKLLSVKTEAVFYQSASTANEMLAALCKKRSMSIFIAVSEACDTHKHVWVVVLKGKLRYI